MENEKEKRIGANKREGVWWIRGKKKRKSKKKKGRKIGQRREGKTWEKRKKGSEKKKGDFPGVPMVESRRFES